MVECAVHKTKIQFEIGFNGRHISIESFKIVRKVHCSGGALNGKNALVSHTFILSLPMILPCFSILHSNNIFEDPCSAS